jgi:hypothetical protein
VPTASRGGDNTNSFSVRELGHGNNLQGVMTAYWPAVKASAAGDTSRSGDRKDEPLLGGLMRALWVAPQTRDGKGSRSPNGAKALRPGGPMLNEQMVETADMALWSAPNATNSHGNAWQNSHGKVQPALIGQMIPSKLPRSVATARGGPMRNGSPATTKKSGAPNPEFPCWLMGCPVEWLLGVLSAMRFRRSSRPKSLQLSLMLNAPAE